MSANKGTISNFNVNMESRNKTPSAYGFQSCSILLHKVTDPCTLASSTPGQLVQE